MTDPNTLTQLSDAKKIGVLGTSRDSPEGKRIVQIFKQANKKASDAFDSNIAICLLGVYGVNPQAVGIFLNQYYEQNVPVVGVIMNEAHNIPQGGKFIDIIHERDLWIALTGENPLPYKFNPFVGKLFGKYENQDNAIINPFCDHLSKLALKNPDLTVDEALHVGIPEAQLCSADEFLGIPRSMTCTANGLDMNDRKFSYSQMWNKPLVQFTTPFLFSIDLVPKDPNAKIIPTEDLIDPEQLAVIQQIEAQLDGQKLTFKDFWDEKIYLNHYCAVNRQVVFLSINGKVSGSDTIIKLTELPNTLGKLKSLRNFWLTDVEIEELPPSFEDLENLKELCVIQTNLKRLGNLRKMHKLWHLNAMSNQLEGIPPDLIYCEKLSRVSLKNNPLNEADYALYQDAITYGIDEKEYVHEAGLARIILELRKRATQKDPSSQLPPPSDLVNNFQTQIAQKKRITNKWIESSLFHSKNGIWITISLGIALAEVGEYRDLIHLFSEFRQKVPELPSVADRLYFEYLLKDGDAQEALKIAQSIDTYLTTKENKPQPEFLVRAYIHLCDWEKAFKKLEEMDKDSGLYYYYAGIISEAYNLHDQAIESFSWARDHWHWSNCFRTYTPEKAQMWIDKINKGNNTMIPQDTTNTIMQPELGTTVKPADFIDTVIQPDSDTFLMAQEKESPVMKSKTDIATTKPNTNANTMKSPNTIKDSKRVENAETYKQGTKNCVVCGTKVEYAIDTCPICGQNAFKS